MKLSVRPSDINAYVVELDGSGIQSPLPVSSFMVGWYILWASIEHIRLYMSSMAVVK